MKTKKLLSLIIASFSIAVLLAQETENKNEIKEIAQANEAIKDANATIKNTNESLKSTVDSSKETIATIGSLFGSGKQKEKTKSSVTINIQKVSYDDTNLNALYKHVSKSKGVKSPIKKFSNGTALITLDYKKSADELWQNVPENLRSSFKMIEMGDNNIVLQRFED